MTTYWPVDREQDKRIRGELVKKIRERSNRNHEFFTQDMPGLPKQTWAERLVKYRTRSPEDWAAIMLKYPKVARAELLDWAQILRTHL